MPTTTWYPVADTYVSSSEPTTDLSSQSTVSVARAQSGEKVSVPQYESFFRFLSSPISALSVSSASLVLFTNSGSGSPMIHAQRLTGNNTWTGITYNSRGGVTYSGTEAPQSNTYFTPSVTQYQQNTIALKTSEVFTMLTGSDITGLGLFMNNSDVTFGISFFSKEEASSGNGSYRPYLTATYTTNTAPTISPSSPADTATVSDSTPDLTVTITDPDSSQTLTTYFDVASNTGFTTGLQSGSAATLTSPQTNASRTWTPTTPLTDGVWYWRARVYDGTSYSAYTTTRSFTVATNVAPTITPSTIDNAAYGPTGPTLAVAVTDPDASQTLTVTMEVWDGTQTTMLWTDSKTVSTPASSTAVNFSPPTTTGTFKWRARVTDGTATSAWTAYRTYKLSNLLAGSSFADDLLVGTVNVDAVYMGTDLVWERILVPVANFIISTTAPYRTGASLQFTSQATNTPTSWEWDFGDGTTSTLQNPTKTYATAGARTVQHRATNANGTGAWVSQSITVVIPEPVSSFTVGTPRQPNVAIQFTDTSTNSPTSWAWDFGDGTTSTLQNPSKTYTTEGNYTVTMTATNSTGAGNQASTNISVVGVPVYTGIVAMFNTTTLPTGWVLCDGTNGTKDLRDRFVVGAGLSYTLGASGGANTVTLVEANLPNHSHNASADTNTTHTHSGYGNGGDHGHSVTVSTVSHEHNYTGHGNYTALANQFANYSANSGTATNFTSATTEAAHNAVGSNTSNHSHTASTSGTHAHNASANNAGSGGAHENRPPYHALVFAQATATAEAAVGVIAMTEGAVPTGWVSCDATNLPDLRDRFVVGSQLTYALGAVGGSNAVTLTTTTMPSHNHAVGVTTDNTGHAHSVDTVGHTHSANAFSAHSTHIHLYGFQTASTLTIGGNTGTTVRATPVTGQITSSAGSATHNMAWGNLDSGHSHNATASNFGSHAHNVSGGNSGSGGSHENRPPYRAATFIRKTTSTNEFPVGTIVMFNGTTIPIGWAAATNYRDNFPVGAGLTYAVGAVGGANAVDIQLASMPQHAHSGSTDTSGDHTHNIDYASQNHSHSGSIGHGNHTHGSMQLSTSNTLKVTGSAISPVLQNTLSRATTEAPAGNNASHSHTVNAASNNALHNHSLIGGGSHSHSANMGGAGSGTAHENRPPYVALTFIIKT